MLQQLIAVSPEGNLFTDVNLRLGGFHLLMSFMEAIGNIMSGSGIKEVWSTIYAPNVASQLLTGHLYSRTLRAHFLTQRALVQIIFNHCNFDHLHADALKLLKNLNDNSHFDDLEKNLTITEICNIVNVQLDELREQGNTARLWVQYYHAVNLMRNFVEAERSGNSTTVKSLLMDPPPP